MNVKEERNQAIMELDDYLYSGNWRVYTLQQFVASIHFHNINPKWRGSVAQGLLFSLLPMSYIMFSQHVWNFGFSYYEDETSFLLMLPCFFKVRQLAVSF